MPKFGYIRLIRLQLLRSTAGEGEDIEGEHHVLLPAEVAEPHGLSFGVCERGVWGGSPIFNCVCGASGYGVP